MKNVNGLAKLLALGALTITISITTVSGGKITASISLGDAANIVKPISYAFNEANMRQSGEKLGDFVF